MTMPLHGQFVYRIVIALLLGSSWFNQVHAGEPVSASPAMAPQPPALSEKELFPYKQKGRGTLAGQVFLGSSSGKAITQPGAPVHLIPITSYTRYWFDHSVRGTACSATGNLASAEGITAPRPLTDCVYEALPQLRAEKRLTPYLRITRANPTGHFWFTKIPAGRYYIVSLIEGGSGTRQEEEPAALAWLVLDLEAGEKISNLVVTDCKTNLC
jgi:hypothetical protein